jgi:hypothetical protein
MATGRIFAIIAVVLFAVLLVLSLVGGTDKQLLDALFYGGLTSFAAAHAF